MLHLSLYIYICIYRERDIYIYLYNHTIICAPADDGGLAVVAPEHGQPAAKGTSCSKLSCLYTVSLPLLSLLFY